MLQTLLDAVGEENAHDMAPLAHATLLTGIVELCGASARVRRVLVLDQKAPAASVLRVLEKQAEQLSALRSNALNIALEVTHSLANLTTLVHQQDEHFRSQQQKSVHSAAAKASDKSDAAMKLVSESINEHKARNAPASSSFFADDDAGKVDQKILKKKLRLFS